MKIVNKALRAEFRLATVCEVCREPSPGCDPAHVFAKGMGGGGTLDIRINLLAACRGCHGKMHAGKISLNQVLKIVAKRERTTPAKIRDTIAMLRRLQKGAPVPKEIVMPARKPVQGTAVLTLTISTSKRRTHYRVVPLQPHPDCAQRAWRLGKDDGEVYEVHVDRYGAHCTCPDFTFARDNKDPKGCKHIAAMVTLGLIPARQPVAPPVNEVPF